jgi:ABC-type enterobactin transport system permease subunit
MFAGVLTTGALLPAIAGFFTSTARGALTLPDVLGISHGVAILIVVALALVGFAFAARIERRAA